MKFGARTDIQEPLKGAQESVWGDSCKKTPVMVVYLHPKKDPQEGKAFFYKNASVFGSETTTSDVREIRSKAPVGALGGYFG